MKYFGAIIVLAYAGMTWAGWEPFSNEQRDTVPAEYRSRPGGWMLWYSGYNGGK